MKKSLFICLLIIIIFAFSSCNEASHNTDPQEEGVINVDNGSLDKNLSSMKAGDELSFRMGSEGTLNLSGVNLDSLFSVEFEGGNAKGTSRGMSGGNSEISRVDKNGPFILIPQASGEVSFSGSDVGASIDDGIVKLKKIGNDLRVGKNYVEYDVPPTGKDYKKEGYPEYQWPTYQNYIHIDFNSPQWSPFKDKKIVIMQNAFFDSVSEEAHGGRSTNNFGLLENGNVIYSNEIEGLYNLEGKSTLNLYTFLRTSEYKGSASVFRTYLLIPEVVSSTPMDIVGYPHVFRFNPEDDQAYEITITGCPKGEFHNLISDMLQGRPRYINDETGTNGKDIEKIIWIKNIDRTGDNLNVTLFFKGAEEDFILSSYWRQRINENEAVDATYDFGTISMEKSENQSWTADSISLTDIDSHTVNLIGEGSGPRVFFKNIAVSIPEDGKTYALSVTCPEENDKRLLYLYQFRGSGVDGPYGRGLSKRGEMTSGDGDVQQGETKRFILNPGIDGYFTFFTTGKNTTFSYKLTEI